MGVPLSVDKVFERASAICYEEESEILSFARQVWLRAQETNLEQLSAEMMVAFAEEVALFEKEG